MLRGDLAVGRLPGGELSIEQGSKHIVIDVDAARWLMLVAIPAALCGPVPPLEEKGQIEGQMSIAA